MAMKNMGIISLNEINLHLSKPISTSALSSSFLFEVDSPVNIIPWKEYNFRDMKDYLSS